MAAHYSKKNKNFWPWVVFEIIANDLNTLRPMSTAPKRLSENDLQVCWDACQELRLGGGFSEGDHTHLR
jgi:hypothetical protein